MSGLRRCTHDILLISGISPRLQQAEHSFECSSRTKKLRVITWSYEIRRVSAFERPLRLMFSSIGFRDYGNAPRLLSFLKTREKFQNRRLILNRAFASGKQNAITRENRETVTCVCTILEPLATVCHLS